MKKKFLTIPFWWKAFGMGLLLMSNFSCSWIIEQLTPPIENRWQIVAYTVNGVDSMEVVKRVHLEDAFHFLSPDKTNDPWVEVYSKDGDTSFFFRAHYHLKNKGKEIDIFPLRGGASGYHIDFEARTRRVIPGKHQYWQITRLKRAQDLWLRQIRNGKEYIIKFKSL